MATRLQFRVLSPRMSRLAAGALALVSALALFAVSTAWADDILEEQPRSTTCGAGTLEQCGTKPITKCEVELSFNFNLFSRSFGFHFDTSNCQVIGQIPIYKDVAPPSSLRLNCTALNPLLGSSAGPGC